MTVKYFGMIASSLQKEVEKIDINTPINASELSDFLTQKYPVLADLSFQIAVNHQIAGQEDQLHPDDEIALLPPFAGG